MWTVTGIIERDGIEYKYEVDGYFGEQANHKQDKIVSMTPYNEDLADACIDEANIVAKEFLI